MSAELEHVLRPRGAGRFVSAAFLAFWLCGWAAGEAFALWVVGATAIPLPAAVFLLFWLGLWTLGGYAAIKGLLRLVWSSDRIAAGPSGLNVVHRLGPFRSTVEIPRDTLRRIYVARGDKTLRAETDAGPIVLSSLGAPSEREQVAVELREALRVPEDCAASGAASLPAGWEEIVTPEGETALVSHLAVRRKLARVALGLTVLVTILALTVLVRARSDAKLIGLAAMACTAAAGLAWGTARLQRCRTEWRIGSGMLIKRQRSGPRLSDRFVGSRLELTRTSDSDGDDWFALEALASESSKRSTIERALRDPEVPQRLGTWLAQRTRIPFEDRSARDVHAPDRERALAQLRESGALGRTLAGWIERRAAKPRG